MSLPNTPLLKLAYGNLIDATAVASASSALVTMPADLTAADFRGVWTRTDGDVTDVWWQATLAEAAPVNCCAVMDTNLTAEGTVELRASTDGFATSNVQLFPPQPLVGNPALIDVQLVDQYTSFRFVMNDPGNTDGYIQFGKLFLGMAYAPRENYSWDWGDGSVDTSERVNALNSVPHFNRKPILRRPVLAFERVPTADRDIMKALVAASGNSRPFFIALDANRDPRQTIFARLVGGLPDPREQDVEQYGYQVQLEEGA